MDPKTKDELELEYARLINLYIQHPSSEIKAQLYQIEKDLKELNNPLINNKKN